MTTGHPWFLWLRAREAHGTGQGTVCGSSLGSEGRVWGSGSQVWGWTTWNEFSLL